MEVQPQNDEESAAPLAPSLDSAKLTPMMRQYLSVKADHPSSIVRK